MTKKFPKLNLPDFEPKCKVRNDNIPYIFDEVRKKWLQLTPEEWVRQHWINYLHKFLNIPLSLMEVEGGKKVNKMAKRSDLVVYLGTKPLLLLECKSSSEPINEKVLKQILNYNKEVKAKYLVLSNGLLHKALLVDHEKQTIIEIDSIPDYKNWNL